MSMRSIEKVHVVSVSIEVYTRLLATRRNLRLNIISPAVVAKKGFDLGKNLHDLLVHTHFSF